MEALADAGVRQGLSRDLSQNLATHTILGAARMVLETKKHPASLKVSRRIYFHYHRDLI